MLELCSLMAFALCECLLTVQVELDPFLLKTPWWVEVTQALPPEGWVFSSTACLLPYSNLSICIRPIDNPQTQLMWQALDFHSVYFRPSGTQEETNNFVYSGGRKTGHWFQRSQENILRKRDDCTAVSSVWRNDLWCW